MNSRQSKLYVHKITIYKPRDIETLVLRDIRSLTYNSATPVTAYGYMNTKPEISQDSYVGRMLAQGTFVSVCEISFEVSVSINTNDIVYFDNPGHPNHGEWYQVIGNPKVKSWRANKLTVYVHRVIRPKII